MPGCARGSSCDLPRKRLAYAEHRALAERLRRENYGTALVMPRTWKAALAPFLAGIPERTGLFGEWRFGLLNDLRFGERKLPRMIDQCAALALPAARRCRTEWPLPELGCRRPRSRAGASGMGLDRARAASSRSRRARSARRSAGRSHPTRSSRGGSTAEGIAVWVLGGPDEKPLAAEIVADAGPQRATSPAPTCATPSWRSRAADVAVSNDSGLLHVAAALGTPTIGIFGPTSPWHWAPLNPLAAIVADRRSKLDCRPCHKPTCRVGHHRCMRDIPAEQVLEIAQRALAHDARSSLGAIRSTAAITSSTDGIAPSAADDLDRARAPADRAGPARCRRRSRPAARRARPRDAAGRYRRRRRTRARAISRATSSSGCTIRHAARCGTAAAISSLRRRSVSLPHGSTGSIAARRKRVRERDPVRDRPFLLRPRGRMQQDRLARRRAVPSSAARSSPKSSAPVRRIAERRAGEHAVARDRMQRAIDADGARRRTTLRHARARCRGRSHAAGRARGARSARSATAPACRSPCRAAARASRARNAPISRHVAGLSGALRQRRDATGITLSTAGCSAHQRRKGLLDHPAEARAAADAGAPRSPPACDGSRRRARRS